MKGIIKGSVFSILLSVISVLIFSLIRLYFEVNDTFIRFILWALFCVSIFFGALFVSKAADNKKAVKGIISSLLSSVILILILVTLGKCNISGSIYTVALLCIISGVIGSFTGGR